ncbi:MAG TPA: hypothetical protein VFR67_12580 [Pilimelia sp.]|nr:hypothetical protein [Pilimelia sp.]
MTGWTPAADGWRGFHGGAWRQAVDVADFVRHNHIPYEGDAVFLAGPTDRARESWARLAEMFVKERRRDGYDVDATPTAR